MALFRNISWPRIFAEGVVIVVSILLALWIDTWWGERQERKLELDYLEALQKDFEETRENLEIHIEEVSILLDQVDKVLTVVVDTKSVDLPDEFSEMVGDAYRIPRPVAVTGTYEDMVNSGSLRLLRSDDLRVAMAEFMSILELVDFHSDLNVQTYWALHAPFINKYLLMNEFGWLVEDSDGEDRDVTFVVGPTIDHQFSIPADAVKTQEFWNLMIGWKALFADQLARVIEARNLSTEIIDMASDNIGSNSR